MRCVVQKVSSASVAIEGETIGSIDRGYLILVGLAAGDTEEVVAWMAKKVVDLRLFEGSDGTINDSTLLQVGGSVLVISQFTLFGDVAKGNRPDYTAAAPRAEAERLYERFVAQLCNAGVARVETGRFGAHMVVSSANDGPVTLILER